MKCIFPVDLIRRAHCSDEEKIKLYPFVQKILAESSQVRHYGEVAAIDEDREDLRFLHDVYFAIKNGKDIQQAYIEPLLQSSYFGSLLLTRLISIVAAVGLSSRDSRSLFMVRLVPLFSPPDNSDHWIQDWESKLS